MSEMATMEIKDGKEERNSSYDHGEELPVQSWTEEEVSVIKRKLDMQIVPFICITYLIAFLDRSMIGNAKTAGMDTDLGLSDSQYQWLLTIFYIAYIVFQFGLLGYKLLPPSKWMASCVLVWGVASILQATAYNWSGLMAARFFIGISEAAYGTGVALYLSFFYPRSDIGIRFGWYVVGSAIASAIAGSVAYALQGSSAHIDKWRLIFLVEGGPTVIMAILIWVFMPDSIATARLLTPREKEIAEARLYRMSIDKQPASQTKSNTIRAFIGSRLNLSNAMAALTDPINYLTAALLFIINVGYAAIPVYLPTILQGMGYTALRAQAFSAPPYVGAFIIALAVMLASDRLGVRGPFLAVLYLIGAVGYMVLGTVDDNHARYGAVWLVVIGLFPSVPVVYMLLANNQAGESKRGVGLVLFGTIGQCGPILGTRLFPSNEAPYYRKGMFVSGGLLFLGFVVASMTSALLLWRNRQREAQMEALASGEGGDGRNGEKVDENHDDVDSGTSNDGSAGGTLRTSEAQVPVKLRYKLHLDLSDPVEAQEHRRRQVDLSRKGEDSIYFRYTW